MEIVAQWSIRPFRPGGRRDAGQGEFGDVGGSVIFGPAREDRTEIQAVNGGPQQRGGCVGCAVQDLSAVMMVAFATAKSARVPQIGWRAKSRKPRKRLPS
jgi:hypothetical protein